MGTDKKMDYTVMGNAVNLAARLEGVNKQYQTSILMSDHTRKQAGDVFISRQLDLVRVVGIHTPVMLYELTGITEKANSAELHYNKIWKDAMTHFYERRFKEALDIFTDLAAKYPNDTVSAMYVKRCITFIKEPPADDWNGVFYLSEK
jgi:adenylate cyclase